jgi:hypothetical protein
MLGASPGHVLPVSRTASKPARHVLAGREEETLYRFLHKGRMKKWTQAGKSPRCSDQPIFGDDRPVLLFASSLHLKRPLQRATSSKLSIWIVSLSVPDIPYMYFPLFTPYFLFSNFILPVHFFQLLPLFILTFYLTTLFQLQNLYGVEWDWNIIRFEVLTGVIMKGIIFWDMTPCSYLSVNRRFGEKHRLHLQGRKNKYSKPPDFLLNLFLRPRRLRRYVPPKRRLTLNGLHGVISQKIIPFITTALRSSNPIQSTKSSPTFRRDILLPSWGSKTKPSKKQTSSSCCLFAWLIQRLWIWRQYVPSKRR